MRPWFKIETYKDSIELVFGLGEKSIGVGAARDMAGLVSFWLVGLEGDSVTVHIFPKPKYRLTGFETDECDGRLWEFGLGPLLLVCVMR